MSWRWGDRLRCQCEYHLPFKELSPTTKVNLQRRLYCLNMSVRFGNSGLAGYLLWEKTTFCSIVHVTYHPRVVDRHILLCSVTRHRSIPTIKICWRYPIYQAFQSHSWSNSVYLVFPLQMVPDFPTHPLYPWGLIIFSSHHVPCSTVSLFD